MHRLPRVSLIKLSFLAVFFSLLSTDFNIAFNATNDAYARHPLPGMGPSLRKTVRFTSRYAKGTIVVRPREGALYLLTGNNSALRYEISVGRMGFGWSGTTTVAAKKKWPEWRPPKDMRRRDPSLPEFVPPGPYNPMGARALYLFSGGKDTLYRIHGTNRPGGIGVDETSGCFRLTNTDIIDLYQRTAIGAKVIVEE